MSKIEGILAEEMPREKLINLGPENLTNVELLAIILRVGTKDKNVLELSREILKSFDVGLVSRKTYDDLLEFKGVSKAKACQIVSVFELARRLSTRGNEKKLKLVNSQEVFDFVKFDFSDLKTERVMVIFTDSKNQVIKKEFLFNGGLNYSIIDPRNIIKRVLSLDANGFFLVHNHPSNDCTPSTEDIDITNQIKKICINLNIRFLDHVIVGNGNYYSFYEEELI